jgi:DNA-binding PadR family transcriptional regulator
VDGRSNVVLPRALNPTAASLLAFLLEGPKSGWDLVETAQMRIGNFWSLTRSQVYRELAAMAEHGLVRAGETGPRERRPYEITAAGREAFDAWLREMPGTEQIRYPLLLKLSFGRHLPPEVLARFVAEHRAEHRQRLAAYEARLPELRQHADRYVVAVLEFGIRYEQAVLGWLDDLEFQTPGSTGAQHEHPGPARSGGRSSSKDRDRIAHSDFP